MKFFFDRCMPIRLARMVAAYEQEHTVRHHDDDNRFHRETPDIEWIKALAADEPPWIVVSADGRILKNKVERAALISSGLVYFCLAGWG
jgi:predicted nuclease of predicted toxin-antitoxin system